MPLSPQEKRHLKKRSGATDGTRTRDNLNHNQGLYQLSSYTYGTFTVLPFVNFFEFRFLGLLRVT